MFGGSGRMPGPPLLAEQLLRPPAWRTENAAKISGHPIRDGPYPYHGQQRQQATSWPASSKPRRNDRRIQNPIDENLTMPMIDVLHRKRNVS
jgi:hypothetical protein